LHGNAASAATIMHLSTPPPPPSSFHNYIHQSIVVRVFLPPSSTCVDATHDVLALPPSTAPTAPTSLYRSSYPAIHRSVYHAQCGPWFVTYSACSSLLSIQSRPSSIPLLLPPLFLPLFPLPFRRSCIPLR
jgi:hypothetical protein